MTKRDAAIDVLLKEVFKDDGTRYLPYAFPYRLRRTPMTEEPTDEEYEAAEETAIRDWFEFLKAADTLYPPSGELLKDVDAFELWKDFGDLTDFRSFWREKRRLFGERRGSPVNVMHDSRDYDVGTPRVLIMAVVMDAPRTDVKAEVMVELDERHPGEDINWDDFRSAKRKLLPTATDARASWELLREVWKAAVKDRQKFGEVNRAQLANVPEVSKLVKSDKTSRAMGRLLNRAIELVGNAVCGRFPFEERRKQLGEDEVALYEEATRLAALEPTPDKE